MKKMEEKCMKPKIFVSSTYYDLKYAREDLSNFINGYKFEPILFENGDIGYEPGKPLDESCYSNISKSDMVILLIGGQYGSPATGESKDDSKEFAKYMSITRKEFIAANEANIPIFVFIDTDVYAEYHVYEKNKEKIEEKNEITFNAAKDINVFRFISSICKYPNIVVNSFKKISEVKEYLSNQWSNYFLNYLEIRRKEKENEEIETKLNSLSKNIDKINALLSILEKKMLGTEYKESEKYLEIIEIKNILLNSFKIIPFYKNEEEKEKFIKEFIEKIYLLIKDNKFTLHYSDNLDDQLQFLSMFGFEEAVIDEIKPGVEIELRKHLNTLEDEDARTQVAKEMLSDDRCWINI